MLLNLFTFKLRLPPGPRSNFCERDGGCQRWRVTQSCPSASRAAVRSVAGHCLHSATGDGSDICGSRYTVTHAFARSRCGRDLCLRCTAELRASQAGYAEAVRNDDSRVIVFSKTDERPRLVRINVYYTTGTITTCTTHSTKATTHMLRRQCSYDEIWKRGWLPGESARMGRLGHRPVPPEWSILCAMCAVGKRKQAHIAHRLACVIRDPDA